MEVKVYKMVTSDSLLRDFLSKERNSNLVLWLVPADDQIHPYETTTSILFVKSLCTGIEYSFIIDHQDGGSIISLEELMEEFQTFSGNLWVIDKKSFLQTSKSNLKNLKDVNIAGFLKSNSILELFEYETPAHVMIKRNFFRYSGLNKAIPFEKHKEMFSDLFESSKRIINKFQIDESFIGMNEIILESLMKIENSGIFVDPKLFSKRFEAKIYSGNLVYSQYNIFTSTGRPSNRFGGVNYAAINKDDGSRNCFVSRFGKDGILVLADYSAFHPRIISHLIGFKFPDDIDVYRYLAGLYFDTKNPDENQIRESKQLTFKQLYGGVDKKFSHITYFRLLENYIDEIWRYWRKNEFVETPIFKRKITSRNISNPDPPKLLNYILQATETEISMTAIKSFIDLLDGKSSKVVMYTYDSILLDVCLEELSCILKDGVEILKMGNSFPIKIFSGSSYGNLKQMRF